MKNARKEQGTQDDIVSILTKIDDLVSVSGNKLDISAQTIPISHMKADELKAEGFVEAQIWEILKGKEKNLSVEEYADKRYNWMQMREIRKGIAANLDTKIYEDPLFSANQMREIRLGLVDHLDVSSYAKLVLSSTDMNKIRKVLFGERYKKEKNFGRMMEDDETGILIRISDDYIQAYMKIPEGISVKLTEELLAHVLKENDIIYGIKQEELKKIVEGNLIGQEVCVAEGQLPTTGRAGRYELFFENCIENGYTIPPDEEIDYSAVTLIEVAQVGEKLAVYHPPQKNIEGKLVTGLSIDGESGRELPPLTGKGFERKGNTYVATEPGYVSYDKITGTLNVSRVYNFSGDVRRYQSIEYDGTVHISGSVRNSAVVRASGDIIVDGFVENANIYSGQNIVIKSGVNGGGQGVVEAGGSLRGKFFENATIKASGMIEGNYFLNCVIDTDDRVIARGKKARIMGGSIKAAVGVEAVVVGNYLSKKTTFVVGDTIELDKRISVLKSARDKALDELQQLQVGKQKLLMLVGEDQADKNPLYQKTCMAIHTKEIEVEGLEQEIDRLHVVMDRASKAYVQVRKEVQPDIMFIINGVRKKTESLIQRGITLTREKMNRR